MGVMKRNRGLWAVGTVIGVFSLAQVAAAATDVSTEVPGSIVVFPKVAFTTQADGRVVDTVIQITNTSNTAAFAHCFYVNAGVPGQWNETDFDIFLTKDQPTVWVASSGRHATGLTIPGGFAPGLVPPVPFGFQGELKCIQTDGTGAPLRQNTLKGEASLHASTGDVSKYNAIMFQGNGDQNANFIRSADPTTDLTLDLTANTAPQSGDDTGMYSACPDTLLFNFFAFGVNDPVVSQVGSCTAGCPIRTSLTLVPCQEDLEHQVPGNVTVQFIIINEFEQTSSISTTVNCYVDADLNRLTSGGGTTNAFDPGVLGSLSGYARINPVPGFGGVIGVAEERRLVTGGVAAAYAAYNLDIEGNRFDAATSFPVGGGLGPNVPLPVQCRDNPSSGQCDHIILPAF